MQRSFESAYTRINQTILSPDFQQKHRLSDRAFTRQRKLTFPNLVGYLINLRKQTNQIELDQFFHHLHDTAYATRHVTKSAFTQARKHLSAQAFVELNQLFLSEVYKTRKHLKRWKDFRLCAIDGSSLRLPGHDEIIEHYGSHSGTHNQAYGGMGTVSVCYDVLNHHIVDAVLKPNYSCERICAGEHLLQTHSDDLIIYDRGYNAFWLYMQHIQRRQPFVMRLKTKQLNEAKDFIASGEKERIITLEASKTSIQSCQEKGLPDTPIKLRLVRVDLPNEVEVLITNLMDSDHYPAHEFKALYHQRWSIEEDYKRLKQWLEIENFSGQSVLSVEQDFHAKILACNMTALLVRAAQKMEDRHGQHKRYQYRINFAQSLSKMKHHIIRLLLDQRDKISVLINYLIEYMSLSTEARRPGRSYPRKMRNIKNDIHYPAYKSAL